MNGATRRLISLLLLALAVGSCRKIDEPKTPCILGETADFPGSTTGLAFGAGDTLYWIACEGPEGQPPCGIRSLREPASQTMLDLRGATIIAPLVVDDRGDLFFAATNREQHGIVGKVDSVRSSIKTIWEGPLSQFGINAHFSTEREAIIVNDGAKVLVLSRSGQVLSERFVDHTWACATRENLYGNPGQRHKHLPRLLTRIGTDESQDEKLSDKRRTVSIACLSDSAVAVQVKEGTASIEVYTGTQRVALWRLPRTNRWEVSRQGDTVIAWSPDTDFVYGISGNQINGCRLPEGFTPDSIVPGGITEAYLRQDGSFLSVQIPIGD